MNAAYLACLVVMASCQDRAARDSPPALIAEGWDYGPAMRPVAARFTGREGVVLHVGDSITYANPYSQWARQGKGKTARDVAICRWMHTGEQNDLDGWYLCSVDRPGGRSETAAGGLRADELLRGGRAGLPSLAAMLKKYNPQIVVLMIGTNDASAGRPRAHYEKDMRQALKLSLGNGTIPILSTIPPHPSRTEVVAAYNDVLRRLAKDLRVPLLDYHAEILTRRPADWNGTLLGKDDVHPTVGRGGATAASAPTAENLRNSGYLLRGWLSVQKVAEVKERVLDRRPGR